MASEDTIPVDTDTVVRYNWFMKTQNKSRRSHDKRLEKLAQHVYLSLFRTHEALLFEFKVLLKEQGLSEPQYNVLRILRAIGKPLQVYQVAERMLTRQPDITRLFDRLVREKLVERTRCEDDRRVVWVTLTTKGSELVKELDRPVMALHRKQLAHLGVRKLRLLNDLLEEARSEG